MQESMYKFMKVGIIHFMAYPYEENKLIGLLEIKS